MKFHYILSCIVFNTTYALYGLPCSNDTQCRGYHELCIAGRCGCQRNTVTTWNLDYKAECDEWHVDACNSDDDCGGWFDSRICNMYGVCECSPGEIYVGYYCYKTDKPIGNSFLKDCNHDLRILRDDRIIPICHPEDNVFCSTFLSPELGNDILSGKCICYPGFYGDNETKLCRPKSEYIQANDLKEYKVMPGMFCHSDGDCIEGLDCKYNFCQCPGGCVYKSIIESCDCGDYYDSDEYLNQSYMWPKLVGIVMGTVISCGWCYRILDTIEKHLDKKIVGSGDGMEINRDEQALNHLPTEVNQSISVSVVGPSDVEQNSVLPQPQANCQSYPIGTSPMADSVILLTFKERALSSSSGTLPYTSCSIESCENDYPSIYNAPPPYTSPHSYVPHHYSPQSYGPRPSAPIYAPDS